MSIEKRFLSICWMTRLMREIVINDRSNQLRIRYCKRCRAQDLAAQSCRRVFIDEHFVAFHCLSIHQMKPRRRSLTINPRWETRPTTRNLTNGNESNLLNIACGKVNGTNIGAIAMPDLRRLSVDESYSAPTYYGSLPCSLLQYQKNIIIEKYLQVKINQI